MWRKVGALGDGNNGFFGEKLERKVERGNEDGKIGMRDKRLR